MNLKVLINGSGLAVAKYAKEKGSTHTDTIFNTEAMVIAHKSTGITGNRSSCSRHMVGGRISRNESLDPTLPIASCQYVFTIFD